MNGNPRLTGAPRHRLPHVLLSSSVLGCLPLDPIDVRLQRRRRQDPGRKNDGKGCEAFEGGVVDCHGDSLVVRGRRKFGGRSAFGAVNSSTDTRAAGFPFPLAAPQG
jgi:hypothetical protein